MTLGEELRQLRERSWYRLRSDLAARAQVSIRTVELIEADAVLPKPETLAKLLIAMGASVADSQRLRRLRDRIDARRRGFEAPEFDDLLAPRLAEAAIGEVVWYLRRNRQSVTAGDVRAMKAKVLARIHAILAPPAPPEWEPTTPVSLPG